MCFLQVSADKKAERENGSKDQPGKRSSKKGQRSVSLIRPVRQSCYFYCPYPPLNHVTLFNHT